MGRTDNLDLEAVPPGAPIEVTGVSVFYRKSMSFAAVLLLSCVFALSTGCGFHFNSSNTGSVILTPTSKDFGSVKLGDTSTKQRLILLNKSLVPITISSILSTLKDFVLTSDCPMSPSTLAPTETCTVTVEFSPTTAGSRAGTVDVAYTASNVPVTASVTGTGMGSTGSTGVSLSPSTLSWTNITVGQTSPAQNVTLTNLGSSSLTISSINAGSSFAISSTTCPVAPATLAGGATCTIAVTFKPSAAGSSSDSLTVVDSDPSSPQKVALTGTAVEALSGLVFSPASLTFASTAVGSTAPSQAAVLTNQGSTSVTINSITASTDFIQTNNCPAALTANTSCTVNVAFDPSTSGAKSGSVTVTYPSGSQTLSLSGTATGGNGGGSGVSLSPSTLSWTNIAVGQTSPAQNVTLTNLGSSSLTISSINAGSPYEVNSTTCPVSPAILAGGASCTIAVVFKPTAPGSSSDSLTVVDSDPSSPQKVALTGTAVQAVAALIFTPTSLTFASTDVGDTTPSQAAVLTNKGSTSVPIDSITSSADFIQTSNCPAALAANTSCTVYVEFAPSTSGAKSGSVTVTYPSGSQSLTLSGTATGGGGVGLVTFTPDTHTFPNQAVGVSSPPTIITLKNGQTTALNISSIQIAAPFSESNTCGTSLAAGSSCAITVIYAPKIGGTNSAKLTVTDDAGDSPQTALIYGSAGQPDVSTIPAAGGLYFYNQIVLTKSSPLPITVTNNQSIPLTITGITSTAEYPFTTDCVGTSGTGTLAPNTSCTIEVTFYPQVGGKRVASLTISHNAKGSPIIIPLTGTAIASQPGLRVTVGPPAPCAMPSQSQQFVATVTGTTNTAVTWYVNDVLNGNSSVGTITNGGLYTAPGTVGSYSIKAISQASPNVYGLVAINITNTPSFTIYPFTSSIPVQGLQTFQPQICAAPDAGTVTWTVDNVPGGNSTVGTVSSSGVYMAPAVAGKHTVRVTDTTLNKTSGAVVTVFSNIAVDFGSRTSTDFPVPPDMFGASRAESLQTVADRNLLTQAGVTVARLNGQVTSVFATQTPDWTKIDPYVASIQAAGQKVLLQITSTPPWLLPDPNPCGAGVDVAAPTDPVKWGQMAASYVAHMDATFPGVVQDYEIWNEPNASGLCGADHQKSYTTLYAAAAPLMKQQSATDGATIHVGGPATAGFQPSWATAMLTDPTIAPYVDFISYHQYMFDKSNLQVQWDTYNGNVSMYQQVQDSGASAQAVYKKAYATLKAAEPNGVTTPIYITEYNTNWAFFKDCCRNDPTYAPVWNALYVTDLLDTAYLGLPVPEKLVYFAATAYPWICMIGVLDPNLDCLYSPNSVAHPYPQYYAYQLLSSRNYLGLEDGGHLAKTVAPPVGGGGVAVAAFYNVNKDAILITNPTAAHYSQIQVSLQNVGFGTPKATLYQIVNGALINSSSLALTPQGSGYSATIDVPPYSVQGIAVTGP
jgi:Glycosyl hydrolases family 39/Rib domain